MQHSLFTAPVTYETLEKPKILHGQLTCDCGVKGPIVTFPDDLPEADYKAYALKRSGWKESCRRCDPPNGVPL